MFILLLDCVIHCYSSYLMELFPVDNNSLIFFFLVFFVISLFPHVFYFSLVRFSSVAQSCLTLWDPMHCSMPGLPVHHQLLRFTQTHVRWVGDDNQSSHSLLSPSPPAFTLSQHQGLFQWVSSSLQKKSSRLHHSSWRTLVKTCCLSFSCSIEIKTLPTQWRLVATYSPQELDPRLIGARRRMMIEVPETSPVTSPPAVRRRSTSTLWPSSLTLPLTTPAWKHPEARARPTWSCLCSSLSTCKHTPVRMRAHSVVSDSVTLWTVPRQAPLSRGFPRREYWRGLPLPSPGGLPNPGMELSSLASPTLAGRFFITASPGKAKHTLALLQTPAGKAWLSAPRAQALLRGASRPRFPPLVSGLVLTWGWGELFSMCEAAYTDTFQREF